MSETEDASKQPEKMDCTPSEDQKSLTTDTEVASPKSHVEQQQEENKSSPSPLKETNLKADSPVKSDVDKPRMLFGVPANLITVNSTLMMKKRDKKGMNPKQN